MTDWYRCCPKIETQTELEMTYRYRCSPKTKNSSEMMMKMTDLYSCSPKIELNWTDDDDDQSI